jgi:hypothetical protein
MAEALVAASTFGGQYASSRALAALAPHLPEPLLGEALETARAIKWGADRSRALAAIAPNLPEPQRMQALAEALKALGSRYSRYAWSRALKALAPHLPEPLLGEALETARAIKFGANRSRALAAIAPHLPEPQRAQAFAEALGAARTIGDEGDRSSALAALGEHLGTSPVSFLHALWSETLPVLASRSRCDLLSDLQSLLPVIIRLGGPQAAAQVLSAIRDVGRWWP